MSKEDDREFMRNEVFAEAEAMTNPTARERAEALANDLHYTCKFELKAETVDRIEREITAAEQAAREDERRNIFAEFELVAPEDARCESEMRASELQAAFRRGAEWMREQVKQLNFLEKSDQLIDRLPLSPPQPVGGAE